MYCGSKQCLGSALELRYCYRCNEYFSGKASETTAVLRNLKLIIIKYNTFFNGVTDGRWELRISIALKTPLPLLREKFWTTFRPNFDRSNWKEVQFSHVSCSSSVNPTPSIKSWGCISGCSNNDAAKVCAGVWESIRRESPMAWRKANDYKIATILILFCPNLCKSNHSLQWRFITLLKLHTLFIYSILCSSDIKLKLVSKFIINLYNTS